MVGGRKRVAFVILIAVVSAAVAAWVISSRTSRQVLMDEKVRQFIIEHPSGIHFEAKPETIKFLSAELVPVEESPLATEDIYIRELPDKVWVVEYECEGRVWGMIRTSPPPFTRKLVKVVHNADTGGRISLSAKDAPSQTPLDYILRFVSSTEFLIGLLIALLIAVNMVIFQVASYRRRKELKEIKHARE